MLPQNRASTHPRPHIYTCVPGGGEVAASPGLESGRKGEGGAETLANPVGHPPPPSPLPQIGRWLRAA